MKSGKRRTYSFVAAAVFSPALLVATVEIILQYYGIVMDVLSALVAAATVELALLAGLQDRVRGWLTAPELDIEMRLEGPDCHQVPVPTQEVGGTIPPMHFYPVYYYRPRVWNNGESSAEKVEVLLAKVYKYVGGKFQLDKSFPIDNLNWSTVGTKFKAYYIEGGLRKALETLEPTIFADYISPRTYRYCTLGHIWNPKHRDQDDYGAPPFNAQEGRSAFCFDVSFKSNIKYYHLPEGTYGIEILVAASNAKTKMRRFKLTLSGNWSDDEETMLREGLKIEEVKYDFDKYEEKVVSKEEVSAKSEASVADKKSLQLKPLQEVSSLRLVVLHLRQLLQIMIRRRRRRLPKARIVRSLEECGKKSVFPRGRREGKNLGAEK